MVTNDNSQQSVSSIRMIEGGMQGEAKQISVEISHLVAEIINLAKSALHAVHERCAAEQPAAMGR